MQLNVVDQLGTWVASWDALVETAELPTPFLRSWWLEAVASPASRYLLIVEDGDLVGGLALEQVRLPLGVVLYRFAGTGVLCPDHLDVLAAAGRGAQVSAAILDWFDRPGSRIIDLAGAAEHGHLATAVGQSQLLDVAPWAPIPAAEGGYLALRSANFRRNARRSERKLRSHDARYRRVDTPELPHTLQRFQQLQTPRSGREQLLAELPRLARALEAGMLATEAHVDVLEIDGIECAISISFEVAGRLSLYQNARTLDPDLPSVGTSLHLHVIELARSAGAVEVDMLRGAEAYKKSFTGEQRQLMRIQRAYGKRGRVLLTTWMALRGLRREVKRLRHRLTVSLAALARNVASRPNSRA